LEQTTGQSTALQQSGSSKLGSELAPVTAVNMAAIRKLLGLVPVLKEREEIEAIAIIARKSCRSLVGAFVSGHAHTHAVQQT
jgi:hypothetical protein